MYIYTRRSVTTRGLADVCLFVCCWWCVCCDDCVANCRRRGRCHRRFRRRLLCSLALSLSLPACSHHDYSSLCGFSSSAGGVGSDCATSGLSGAWMREFFRLIGLITSHYYTYTRVATAHKHTAKHRVTAAATQLVRLPRGPRIKGFSAQQVDIIQSPTGDPSSTHQP